MVKFTIQIPDGDSHSLALILRPEFVLPWLCLHWETLIMLLSQIPLTFFQTKKGIIPFIARTLQLLLC